ncbi:hypothetical protein GCM10010452_04440 [Crossiella cryophila]
MAAGFPGLQPGRHRFGNHPCPDPVSLREPSELSAGTAQATTSRSSNAASSTGLVAIGQCPVAISARTQSRP